MKRKESTPLTSFSVADRTRLLASLHQAKQLLAGKTVTAGFDGFIDLILKVISKKPASGTTTYFKDIGEFGGYILDKRGASFSLEVEETHMKLGGNMPIMSNALGELGLAVNCIGGLGYPEPHRIFEQLSSNCKLYSFAQPGFTNAYEFRDGKMMMAQMGELNKIGWSQIGKTIGIGKLVRIFRDSDMLCLLNWSELDPSTDIWKGLLKDVLPKYNGQRSRQKAFFDISDCSKRSAKSVVEALDLMHRFGKYTDVTLSLNRNEAGIVYRVLFRLPAPTDLQSIGKKLYSKIGVQTLLLHTARETLALNEDEQVAMPSFFVEDPVISTGAGDNFNAGFCAGQLAGLDLLSCIQFANAVSGCYVREGRSVGMQKVISFIKKL